MIISSTELEGFMLSQVAPVAMLFSTHPAAHRPNVAVTETREP
jgi:hypothetical protein